MRKFSVVSGVLFLLASSFADAQALEIPQVVRQRLNGVWLQESHVSRERFPAPFSWGEGEVAFMSGVIIDLGADVPFMHFAGIHATVRQVEVISNQIVLIHLDDLDISGRPPVPPLQWTFGQDPTMATYGPHIALAPREYRVFKVSGPGDLWSGDDLAK